MGDQLPGHLLPHPLGFAPPEEAAGLLYHNNVILQRLRVLAPDRPLRPDQDSPVGPHQDAGQGAAQRPDQGQRHRARPHQDQVQRGAVEKWREAGRVGHGRQQIRLTQGHRKFGQVPGE